MDELYRVPPAEFTAARDALAKELKAAGDKDAAAEVKALRRPTVGAWAVNQIAWDEPELVEDVIAAGAAVRTAQESLLGGGDRAALREATASRRSAVGAAVKAAVKLAGAAHRDTITATFDAAAADEEAAEAVRAGRLQKELEAPSGFALLDVAPSSEPEPEPEPEPDPKVREAAEQAVAKAQDAVDAAEGKRARLAKELAAAEAALDEANEALAAATSALDDLGGR